MVSSIHVSEWGPNNMNKEYNNIPKEKFVLVNENKKLHDKELVTKPIGFFKDAMHRFAKNKGSIVGAIVIGILVLYAIIVPIFSRYTVSYNDNYYSFILPKVFDNENFDFLDGAKNQTTNLTTFINNYAKGLETGHNAIKRQEYKYNEETGMYSYRLDTYQNVGNVFMSSINRADYFALQDYQDATGIQIIYPITDPTLRPKAQKNLKDANFWYKTVEDGTSNDLPSDYTFNEDGTITLTNIYQKFSVPMMISSGDINEAAYIIPETKDSGFALKMVVRKAIRDEDDNIVSFEEKTAGYINAIYDRELNSTETVGTFEEASVYTFDATHNTFLVNISGHEDASEDGNYFFGLPTKQGSAALLLKESQFTETIKELCKKNDVIDAGKTYYTKDDKDNYVLVTDPKQADILKYYWDTGVLAYIPFSLYDANDNLVTSPVSGTNYFFGVRRTSTSYEDFFCGSFISGKFSAITAISNAVKVSFVNDGTGYKLGIPGTKKGTKLYVKVDVEGNNYSFSTKNNSSDGTTFNFDSVKKCLSLDLTGFTDTSLNGTYYLSYVNSTDDFFESSITLLKEDALNDNAFVLSLSEVVEDGVSSLEPVSSIDVSKSYRLFHRRPIESYITFYIDGEFNGDHYYSKMRIEGEDEYLYDYAIQKNGGAQYEIRVNYYEYYRYYHKMILKDRISEPYFIFGTTATGQDIFTCLASGARFSFILAIIVASVNLVVGAIYGALEGYYGGKVDMIMERIVEILSAVPFMIVITLLKYHMKGSSQALILFISFFLTGWIGMSGTVRMQFYRFKNQEYVLASRTLGAKDPRIMFKHIFPNALGTIVTSSVLVIPGMIFSETSLSYLGIINLNSGNMTSVGTLLANAQPYLTTSPHMILFPAIFISLLMLCFNLFGNGLRDAFNPSLRGTED